MPRTYSVQFTSVAISAAQDLFEIVSASTKVCRILGWELSQSSEVGDAQEENLSILLKRGQTTSGTGGSSVTPTPMEVGHGASSFTAEVNNTTKASTGTIVTLHATNWNERNTPCTWWYPPELTPYLAPSERCTLELVAAGADSLTMSGTMWVEEIG